MLRIGLTAIALVLSWPASAQTNWSSMSVQQRREWFESERRRDVTAEKIGTVIGIVGAAAARAKPG
jgi:hypothetical protein